MTGVRVDKWLWFARFAKTRSLAARLCNEGGVSLAGVPVLKPGHPLHVGDRLAIRHGRALRRVVVLALGERRGPAAEARLLYDEVEPPLVLAEAERALWQPLIDDEA
jgi:ribosome-associated heat shock protein Hsp15